MIRIHDKIRDALEKSAHLTQKGLAARMGLNPAAINRMLHGQRKIMAEEIPVIEDYLGIRLTLAAEYRQDTKRKSRGFAEAGQQETIVPPGLVPSPVPAYRLDNAEAFLEKTAADWVPRHPVQLGSRDAFAVYATTSDMAPRYFPGEIAYIHPGRPPEAGRDVLVVPTAGAPFLARLIGEDGQKLRMAQFSPAREREISKKGIRALYAVVGRG